MRGAYNVVYAPAAQKDIKEIYSYIADVGEIKITHVFFYTILRNEFEYE